MEMKHKTINRNPKETLTTSHEMIVDKRGNMRKTISDIYRQK